jgi:hypothetical protein
MFDFQAALSLRLAVNRGNPRNESFDWITLSSFNVYFEAFQADSGNF